MGVKKTSGAPDRVSRARMLDRRGRHRGGRREENGGGASMPDVLYVVLLIGLFGVLALILRGLERL
ncbi:hypothetical protein FNH05_37135 [Amycolatopsis rhizosphaerae]|uniref:Uncharacterized protein n=1 Tax=Amycolatopsis rhizosphaerae TaxID=2053003 RepID=A0A557ZSE1_9PSEU|nr:hypothetical protein [Amycolatopsis rhizosphaerae]TVT14943.1 hypothetical protein FNH05_37135 [Amycolatopsis rhizosphaerae]